MASILAADSSTTRWDHLAAAGHTVTYVSSSADAATLDAAWGAGHDVIITHTGTIGAALRDWVWGKWSAGTPWLMSVTASALPPESGLTSPFNSSAAGQATQIRDLGTGHPVMAGLTGDITIAGSSTFQYYLRGQVEDHGAVATASQIATGQPVMAAWEQGIALFDDGWKVYPGSTVPARTVALGWANRNTLSTDGQAIIAGTVAWLTGGAEPSGQESGAYLTATPTGSLTLTAAHASGAWLTATPGGSIDLTAPDTPTTSGAWLTATPTGTLILAADGEAFSGAYLTATPTGSLTLEVGDGVGAGAWLTATPDGTLLLDSSAHGGAHLTATPGGSLWLTRQWAKDEMGHSPWSLVAAAPRGGPASPVDLGNVNIAAPVTKRLNDVDGSGTGTTFVIPRTDTAAITAMSQTCEVTVSRGGNPLDTYVLLRPQDGGTKADIPVQALGLGWWLTKRRIGPAHRTQLLPKKWKAGYREGSIPAAPPKWSRVAEPAQVGPSLRVEGSTHVEKTVTRMSSDTTFAPGSWTLTDAGKTSLREFAREVEVDRDARDLIDIAPPTITIEGHTDDVPDYGPGGNQGLSERRAKAVYDFLAPLVPEGTTMTWVGYGDTRPIVPNHPDTFTGTPANRRVDIVYPKIVSARGHRQYLEDVLLYTNPSEHITRNLTLVAWWQLESYKEPNADGSVIFLGRRPVGSGDDGWVETSIARIDEETPLATWTRSEVAVTIPADGQEWEIVARLTPPAGNIIYDEGATNLWADDALEFVDVDEYDIIAGLIAHAQDPAYGKDDLRLAVKGRRTGNKRTRVYYWHERQTVASCLAELVGLVDGPDITIDGTTRTVRVHHPRAGQDTDVQLHLGEGGHVDDYTLGLDGDSSATTVIVQADGQGADREEGVATGTTRLGSVIEDVWTAEPGTHIGELTEQAASVHRRHGGHTPVLALECDDDDTDLLLDMLDLGDRVTVDIPSPVLALAGRASIPAWSIDHATDRVTYAPVMED